MGPLITGEHRDKVARLRRRRQPTPAPRSSSTAATTCPAEGFFLKPTLLDDVTPDMTAYDDEIFGPVLSVVRVASLRRGRSS